MRFIVTITLLCLVSACGAGPEPAAEAPAPTPETTAGPGIAMAPDGVPIAFTRIGIGSPALVFIHGWLCDQSYWSEQIAAFSPEHFVVTVDLAGHGDSGMDRVGWSLASLGADVQSVVEDLDLHQVILIGHSMGGPVALEAARLMPERVVGVIAVDSLHNADFKYDPDQIAGFIAAMEEDFPSYCTDMVTGMFQDGAAEALVDRIRSDMCEAPAEIAVALFSQYADYDMGGALAALDVPIRSINADKWPTDAEANRAYHEDFEAVILPDAGHFLMIDRADEFNARLAEVISGMNQPI